MVVFGVSKGCLKVLKVLSSSRANGTTQKEIIAATGLSVRSVKYALKTLVLRRLIWEIFLMDDLRCKMYLYGGKNGDK
ncbi:MAG TPA: hypothetical protein EYO89_02395 [Candidatus Dadabacteria bacterium]|nr:hypothetical protein [Candidatus Dadabacteria bacterium]